MRGDDVRHDVLDRACLELARGGPARSALRTLTYAQMAFGVLALAALGYCALHFPFTTGFALEIAAKFVFLCAIALRLVAAAASLAPPRPPRGYWVAPLPVYTILCPLRGEERVIGDLVRALSALDYPEDRLDIKLVLEADDIATIRAALSLHLPQRFDLVMTPPAWPRTKPKALNYALAMARGEFVAVYDAEDRPDPRQLRAALDAFANGDQRLAVVQAPLMIDNARSSWIAGQFAVEYAVQFREILPLLARWGLPIPLGGTSNHFRHKALAQVGGWDPFNVTEDADLGYRLARDGWTSSVIDPPTWEEAPVTLRAWILQRARWIKGHMQTWLVLMRNPFRTARELGLRGFLAMQLVLFGGVLAAFVHLPLALILVAAALMPVTLLRPPDLALALAGYATASYAALVAAAVTRSGVTARAALTMPFYWPLHTIAAFRALGSLVIKPHHWRKTAHGVSRRPDYAAA